MHRKFHIRKQHQEIHSVSLQNVLRDQFFGCSLDKPLFPFNSQILEGPTPFCSRPWRAVYHQY